MFFYEELDDRLAEAREMLFQLRRDCLTPTLRAAAKARASDRLPRAYARTRYGKMSDQVSHPILQTVFAAIGDDEEYHEHIFHHETD